MEIKKREDIPENRQVRLTLAVDADTWQQSLARCYEAIKSIAPVDGEPTRANIEAKYGAEFLYQEAVNDTYPQALVEAIQREELLIAGTPTLTVEDIGPEGYTFSAVIDLYPEVQLLLFFIIPIRVKYFGVFAAVLWVFSFLGTSLPGKLDYLLSMLNVWLFFAPMAYRSLRAWVRREQWKRKNRR